MPSSCRAPLAIALFLICGSASAAEPNDEQCADLRAGIAAGTELRDSVIVATTRMSELLEDYLTRERARAGEPAYDELVRTIGQATALARQPLDRHSSEPVARAQSALRALCPKTPR